MAAKLLSSLVQTKSIELVMAPLAAQVSQLIILNEAGEKEGIPMPMLVSHAEKITSAIHDLVIAAQTLVNESNNEVFKSEMPEACALVTAAGNSLHDATNKLLQHPLSREVRYALVDSARNILETTMKVLLVYDKAEVQKIVCATCWVIDRLGLTEAVTSMDGFLVSFRGFSESLVLLVSLCNKRQREVSNSNQRSRLLSAMAILRQAVGVLSSTMQVYFSNPSLTSAKVNRDYVIGQIKFACKEIIKIVENRHDEDNSELPSLSSNMQKAYNQLDSKAALETSNQMDCYLDAIVRSSMAVADLSHDDSRDKIVEACQNVLETRNDLAALQNVMSQTSESGTSSQDYDETTEKLSKGLKDLDSHVIHAITEQINDVFKDVESPVKQIMDVSSYNGEDQDQAIEAMKQVVDDFHLHASKIIQLSMHAASLSSDTQKVHAIKEASSKLESLLPMFMSAAMTVKQNSSDQAAVSRLSFLSREWMSKVQLLVDALDDVTDLQDLLKVSGNSFYQELSDLQDALEANNFVQITEKSEGLLTKGQRFAQITKKALASTSDPFDREILIPLDRLQSGLPGLIQAVDKVLSYSSDRISRDMARKHASSIAEKVNSIQSKVTGSPVIVLKSRVRYDERPSPPVHQSYNGSDLSSTTDHDDLTKHVSREESRQPKRTSSPSSLSVSSDESRGFDQYFDEKADKGMNEADKKSLLGVAGDSRLFGEPFQLSRTCTAPVMGLLQTARNGDRNSIERSIKNVISQATRLMGLAEKCIEKSQHGEQIRRIRVASAEIEKLTPIITQAARDMTSNPRDKRGFERLQVIGREWASKAHVLGDAIDAMVTPWSAAASKLALAAMSGDTAELKRKINNINDEAVRLRQLALSTIAAADAEDYAMDPGNESDDFERNPDSYERIKLLRATSQETDKVIPELILAAQSLIVNPTDMGRLEHLEFLRRVWACNVNDLITAVDDVIVGTSAPVEHLTDAAMVNDSLALQERIKRVVSYTRTLKDMSSAATTGCTNPKKAVLVESTMSSIERLTADLQETAHAVADLSVVPNKSLQQQLAFMSIEEKMKLIRREWATKVHLLTALVDDLTAHVSAPVDRLAGAALAVTKADVTRRLLLEREFEVQAQELSSRVARVRSQASKAVETSSHPGHVRSVRVTGDFIDRLTPQVIGSARALADNPDQPTVEHFQLLRRQWASKAHMLIAILRELHDANHTAVQSVVDNLLATVHPPTESESFRESDFSNLLSSSPGDARLLNSFRVSSSPSRSPPQASLFNSSRVSSSPSRSPPQASLFNSSRESSGRSGSPSPVKKRFPPKTFPRPNKLREKSDRRAVSDSEEPPKPRVPIGASSSETDLRSLLVAELHDRFSSNESLKRSKWDARYWAKFEVNRKKKQQRAFSMADLSKNNSEWISESTEDLRNRKSSKSIERAARFLVDEVDRWEEDHNSIVQIAKKMAQQMMEMAQFARRRGKLQDRVEMTNTAKAIAANSRIIQNFAQVIADSCADHRSREDLLYYAECLPTMSTQLTILASVKSAAPNDPSADAMLVRNAENLMQAVVKTLRAAEAASVQEFVKRPPLSSEAAEAADLAFQWKKKLQRQRQQELFTTSRDHLGLRKRDPKPSPSLVDIVHV